MQPTSFLCCTEGEKVGVWVKIELIEYIDSEFIMTRSRFTNMDVSYKDIFYAYLLLCLSGNPFFPEVFSEWVYVGVALALFLLHFRRLLVDKVNYDSFEKWIIGFIVLFIAQFIFISPVSIPADVNFLAKFFIAFITPCILGDRFRYAYFRAITFTAAVSLVFFFIYATTGWFTGLSFGRDNSILIYNHVISDINYDGTIRNAGMFWEPGSFQGYINLVPVMFYNDLNQLWKQKRRSCIILMCALITTFSTTGYLVFMFIVGSALIKKTRSKLYRGIVAVVVIVAFVYSFISFDFIGKKIIEQFDTAMTIEKGDVSWSRFGAAIIDFHEIARSPITGNGFMMDARYPRLGELMAGSGNGFTGAVNSFGVIIILCYIIQLYKRSSGVTKSDRLICTVAVILLLQGEFFLNYPMFWALLFVIYPKYQD